MKSTVSGLLAAFVLAGTSWASVSLGYRHGLAVSASRAVPVNAPVEQDHWQYQTYDCGKKSDSSANSERVSEIVNSYGAQGFEPCSPPGGVFPDGVKADRLIWFRRQFTPFTPSFRPISENRPGNDRLVTIDN
jgi:hypothetical protein